MFQKIIESFKGTSLNNIINIFTEKPELKITLGDEEIDYMDLLKWRYL